METPSPNTTLCLPAGELETYHAFLDEAREHLENMEEKILALAESCEAEQIHIIFRGLHSIKGVASFLGLADIQRLSHQMESVFDALRQGSISVSEETIHVCLSGLDQLVDMVRNLESALLKKVALADKQFQIIITSLDFEKELQRLSSLLQVPTEIRPIEAQNAEPIEEDLITPEMRAAFKRESEELLESTEQVLMRLEEHPEDANALQQAFRNIHSFKGNCGFFGMAKGEKLAHALESLLECVRGGEHSPSVPEVSLLGLKCVDAFRQAQQRMAQNQVADFEGLDTLVADAGRLLRRIQELGSSTDSVPNPSVTENAGPKKTPSDKPVSSPTRGDVKRDLRIDLVKLDHLLDLVGELVIASGMVTNHPVLRDLNIPDLERSFHQLQNVVSELQEMALGVRMVPIESVFKKMTRLVHDLSAKCGKQIKLDLIGEKTEVDKNLADLLADPLVHMIRNAIDHGMESPDERQGTGKSSTGTLTLSAEQEGGDVVISIRDDGRGMNRDRILAKAIERKCIEKDGSDLSDEEIFRFIFLPGFSTADSITATSGRGVGMDVVKSNVEKMNGRIQIQSAPGKGTSINLRIPLTLSIIEGMQVRVGHGRFILPMLAVKESVAGKSHQIARLMGQEEMLLLRGHAYPIVRLHALHRIQDAVNRIESGILLMLESQGASYGLLVDEIIGQRQTVVKALPSFLGPVPGVTACSILDDGAISLILDPISLWKLHQDGLSRERQITF